MADANSLNVLAQPESSFRIVTNMRLARLDLSVTGLAERLNRARNTVSLAINHERMMPGIKEAINTELAALEAERGLEPL